jgi:hypothetical protein
MLRTASIGAPSANPVSRPVSSRILRVLVWSPLRTTNCDGGAVPGGRDALGDGELEQPAATNALARTIAIAETHRGSENRFGTACIDAIVHAGKTPSVFAAGQEQFVTMCGTLASVAPANYRGARRVTDQPPKRDAGFR